MTVKAVLTLLAVTSLTQCSINICELKVSDDTMFLDILLWVTAKHFTFIISLNTPTLGNCCHDNSNFTGEEIRESGLNPNLSYTSLDARLVTLFPGEPTSREPWSSGAQSHSSCDPSTDSEGAQVLAVIIMKEASPHAELHWYPVRLHFQVFYGAKYHLSCHHKHLQETLTPLKRRESKLISWPFLMS